MKSLTKHIDIIKLSLSVITFIFMFVFSEIVRKTVRSSLNLCATVIIPSLFPYIVITSLLTNYLSGFQLEIKKTRNKKILILISIIISILSGFPAGALAICELYNSGTITKRYAEILIGCFCNISPAFCIYIFGGNILGSIRLGILCLISTVLCDILMYVFFSKTATDKVTNEYYSNNNYKENIRSSKSIIDIICSSMNIVLNICAIVTMYSCIAMVLKALIAFIVKENNILLTFAISLLEITSGLQWISELGFGAKFLYGNALIGFCGLSAITQVCSVCSEYNLKNDILLKSKMLSSVITPMLSTLILLLFPI